MTPGRDDAAVFTRVFDRHRHAVHAFFLGRVSDPELARDLVQETFLRVWRRLSEVRPLADGQPRAWAFTRARRPPPGVGPSAAGQQRPWIFPVARNLAIDSYRTGAARRAAEDALRHQATTRETTVAGPHAQAELAALLARRGH